MDRFSEWAVKGDAYIKHECSVYMCVRMEGEWRWVLPDILMKHAE